MIRVLSKSVVLVPPHVGDFSFDIPLRRLPYEPSYSERIRAAFLRTSTEMPGFANVQTPAAQGTAAASATLTAPAASAPGPSAANSTLVMICSARAATTPTVSLSGVGTWASRIGPINTGAAGGTIYLFDLVKAAAASAGAITITSSQAAGSIAYVLFEIVGYSSAPYEGGTSGAAANVFGSANQLSYTTTGGIDYLVAAEMIPNAAATISTRAASPWNNVAGVTGVAASEGHQLFASWQITTSAAAQTYSEVIATSQNWAALLGAYQAAEMPLIRGTGRAPMRSSVW